MNDFSDMVLTFTHEEMVEHDKQLRAEVIDEFLNKAKELYPNDPNFIYKAMCIAGQLKIKDGGGEEYDRLVSK